MSTNYERHELEQLGFASLGDDVRIDRRVALFGADSISIGSNVRIDCFSVVTASASGPVRIGSHTHLATSVVLLGAAAGIEIEDFCSFAPRVSVFSGVEDYTDGWMATPLVPVEYRKVDARPVLIGKHSIIGAGAVVLAGVRIGRGAAVGALTMVGRDVPDAAIAIGQPVRFIGRRDLDRLARLEAAFTAGAAPGEEP